MSQSSHKCMYCYKAYKSNNYRIKLECYKEICFNCSQFLKNRNKSICPFCERYSKIIENLFYFSEGCCIVHNSTLSHFDKVSKKIICKYCVSDQFNVIPLKKKSEELDKKLSKKKLILKDYLESLIEKRKRLKGFEMILNSEKICYAIQNISGDLEDLETKIKIIKENNLIEYNEKYQVFFKNSEGISEEYLEKFYKELEDLLRDIGDN